MKNYFFLLLAAITCLAACQKITTPEKELSIWPEFSIKPSITFTEKFIRSDGSIAWINYNDNTAHRASGDILVELYNLKNQICSSSLHGASETVSLFSSENSNWGKVDFFEINGHDFEGNPPICEPYGGETAEAYVLCSEKDGKTVVICINEMTNNPELAKEIFETFKWTE